MILMFEQLSIPKLQSLLYLQSFRKYDYSIKCFLREYNKIIFPQFLQKQFNNGKGIYNNTTHTHMHIPMCMLTFLA